MEKREFYKGALITGCILLLFLAWGAGCAKKEAGQQEANASVRTAEFEKLANRLGDEGDGGNGTATPTPIAATVSASVTPSPAPTPQRMTLNLGEQYSFGPAGATCKATVSRYLYMDRYHWWDPTIGRFFPMLPDEANHFLFLFISMKNLGSVAQWIPSADVFSVCGNLPGGESSCYTNLPYQNTTGYDDTALRVFNDTYQWIREVGVNDRDYAYLRASWYLSSGHAGGFLWPGESNAINGYLVYEVPRNLTPENTTVNIWFSNQSRASWVLLNSPVPVELGSLAPDFDLSPRSGPRPLPVQFTDRTTGGPTNWSWDFGDGNTSLLQNPLHTYTEAGSYGVTLSVQNLHAANKTVKMNRVTVWPSEFSNHSVELVTARGGRIMEGSYLHLAVTRAQSSITLDNTTVNLTPGEDATLVFNREDYGGIGIHGRMMDNLTFGDLSLFVNGSFKGRGAVQEINLPSLEILPSTLDLFLPSSSGYTSLSWDDRVVLASEEHSRIFVNNIGINIDGNLNVVAQPGMTHLTGNATEYSVPDTIVGGE